MKTTNSKRWVANGTVRLVGAIGIFYAASPIIIEGDTEVIARSLAMDKLHSLGYEVNSIQIKGID